MRRAQPPVAAARAASAVNAVGQEKRDQPPGGLGLTGVGGVSWRTGSGTLSALGGAGNGMGGSKGGDPFMPSPPWVGGTVTCG